VYYDVQAKPEAVATIRAVKDRNLPRIAGREFQL